MVRSVPSRVMFGLLVVGLIGLSPASVYGYLPRNPQTECTSTVGRASLSAALQELFVDIAHPGCADANPGTQDLPLCSIQAAADRSQPGTKVYVKAGQYTEHVIIRTSGTAQAPISFVNYEEDHVLITSPGDACFDLSGVEYIKIHGFELTGAWPIGSAVGHAAAIKAYPSGQGGFGVRYSLFTDNVVHHNNAGIWLAYSHHNQITNNVVFSNGEAPIRIKRGDYNVIANNLTFNNGTFERWGITFYCAIGTQVYHNTSVELSGGAVYIYEGTANLNGTPPGDPGYCMPSNASVVRDNIGMVRGTASGDSAPLVIGSSSTPDRNPILEGLYGPLTNQFHHNLWYNQSQPDAIVSWGDLAERHTWPGYALLSLVEFQQKGANYGQGSQGADPLFVNAAHCDFRLSSQSPAKGAASDGTDLGVDFAHLPHFRPFDFSLRLPIMVRQL